MKGERKGRWRARVYVTLGAIAGVAVAFSAGAWWGDHAARRSDQWGPERLISTAIDSVRANALDALPSDELLRRAVSGMLRELHDPYATLLRPEGAREYRGLLRGEGTGLGLQLRREDKQMHVVRVLAGSPAAAAGVRAGDRVLSVNGVQVGAPAPNAAADEANAPASSALVLLRPPVGDTVRVSLARGSWHVPVVSDAAMLTNTTGYVALASVAANASDELESAISKLEKSGAQSLVLDLRGNGGGFLEEGIRIAGLFLPKGTLVASLTGKAGAEPTEHRVKHNGPFTTLPLVLLVDARTASSAEIISAALRDQHRALLVGEPTYGKGLVQRVVALTPELSMRMTTGRWIAPKGEILERRHGAGADAQGGIAPDIFIVDAGRRDAMAPPPGLTALASARMLRVADTAAARAIREGWSTASTPLLERRLHSAIDDYLAPTSKDATHRTVLIGEATRLATTRLLEVQGDHEALLRYGIGADHALRAALDVLEPGSQRARVQLPMMADAPISRSTRVVAPSGPTDSSSH
jgi:carboxyl-terminal processing protease